MGDSTKKVAIVVPDLNLAGGVGGVAYFLYHQLKCSFYFEPHLISLAISSRDNCSIRFINPLSWINGIKVEKREWHEYHDIPYVHIGAFFTEFEFQRYRSRTKLTQILNEYDLIQIVAGTPAWANIIDVRKIKIPVYLQVATLTTIERESLLNDGGGVIHFWRKLMTKIVDKFDKKGLEKINHVFVENKWLYDYIKLNYNKLNITFAPPGVNTDIFYPLKNKYSKDFYILSVGRFGDPRKNTLLLFKAFYRLYKIYGNKVPYLVLAGATSPLEHEWDYINKKGLKEYVYFYYKPNTDKLASLYRNAGIFALSSNEEGLGIVILEAMASGVPVVSTDCGGPSTIIRHKKNGYLVPVDNEEKMANSIVNLIQKKDLRQNFIEQGLKDIKQNFNAEETAKKFISVYKQNI